MANRLRGQIQSLKRHFPWISTPLIIGAPMRVFAGPELAAAITQAGGIGFIGPGAKPTDLENALSEARVLLPESPSSLLPIGIGFQTFDADLSIARQAIQRHKPCAVWLFAPRNGQAELDIWSQNIRKVAPETQIWLQVGSVMNALEAARSISPPDVLVLQGIDAGGHGLSHGAGIISLLPEVADALGEINVPLVAAGGIADGRGVAAALSLGAVGAVMGTRFLASKEAKVSRGYQEDILRATDGGQNTVRTTLYDKLAGRTDWPSVYDGRNIVNKSIVDHESGMDFEENKELYKKAIALGDDGWGPNGRLTAYVGSAIGLVHEVAAAKDIVKNSQAEAIASLDRVKSVL